MATYLIKRGLIAEAEPLHQQALEIRREALGERHPSFAVCLENLAGLYDDMGRHDKAAALRRQLPGA